MTHASLTSSGFCPHRSRTISGHERRYPLPPPGWPLLTRRNAAKTMRILRQGDSAIIAVVVARRLSIEDADAIVSGETSRPEWLDQASAGEAAT